MIHELIQEVIKLKKDNIFVNNLLSTLITVIILCLSIEYNTSTPNRLGKQEKIAQFSNCVAAGIVIKTYKYFDP